MSWAKAHIEIRSASVGTGIKVSMKRTNKSSARMTFTISDATGKSFGWAGGDKVEVMLGEGEHHGLLRLRKNNSAGQAELSHREMAKGAWFTLKLGHQHSFVDRSEPALWCQWEKVEDSWIEIVLPKWADETAPNRKPQQAAPEPVKRGPGRPPATSVTASLMGDPAPNRKEMLARMGEMKA
jgi:hypothetical protein